MFIKKCKKKIRQSIKGEFVKLFLDTANLKEIKKWNETGLIDGVTTNPTHLSKEKGDPKKLITEICSVMSNGNVSIEVTETKPDKVYKQAKEIAEIAKNVTVKIPCHRDFYEVIKKLSEEDIDINVTLVFTLLQGLMMCKLGVKYISPFVGRWNDIDVDGIDVLEQLRYMVDEYAFIKTQIIAASIRSVKNFHDSIMAGADIVTLPVTVLEKATKHVLTDQGIEKFLVDWKKLGVKQFP